MNRFTLLILTILMSTELFAQNATISGVVSAEGEPVPFANILLNENKKGATAGIDGKFTLSTEPGTYTLVISSVGYQTLKEKVTLTEGQKLEKSFVLKKGTELEMFVKTEGKYDKKVEELTVSLEIIKPNIIENKNATTVDQALQQTPGLVIVDNEPQMRGGSGYSFGAGSRVMVLVDDLPMLSGDAGRPSWGFIPVENLEQIEIVKGASSVLYGSGALNGVINIRSAYPTSTPKTKVTFFGGVYDVAKKHRWYDARTMPYNAGLSFLHARQLGKKNQFDLVVGGNILTEDGYIGYTKDTSGTVDPKSREFDRRARFNFNFRHRIEKVEGLAWGINGNFMYNASAGAFIWQGLGGDSVYRAASNVTTRTLQTVFHIDPFVTYASKNGSSQSLRLRYFSLNNNNDNNQSNSSQYIYGEYQYRLVFPRIKDFVITPGVMFNYTIGKAQLFAGNQPPLPSGYDSISTDKIGTYSMNAAVYVQIEKKFLDRITLSGGARLEYFNIGKNDRYLFHDSLGNAIPYDTSFKTQNIQPVFRFGASARVHKATFIRASFGQGFRFPTIAERFVKTTVGPAQVYPNPDLKPEKSWSVELGVKQGFKIGSFKGFADVAGFFQRYNNTIEFVAAQWGDVNVDPLYGFGFKSINIGKSMVYGVDASIMGTGEITKDLKMDVLIGYTYSNPLVDDPNYVYGADPYGNELTNLNTSDTARANPRQMKYRYKHLVRADIEFTYKFWSIGGSLRYNSFMDNVDNIFLTFDKLNAIKDVIKSRDYHKNGDYVIDLRTSFMVKKGHKFSFICNNVLNRVYSLRPVSVEAPRSFIFQYQATF